MSEPVDRQNDRDRPASNEAAAEVTVDTGRPADVDVVSRMASGDLGALETLYNRYKSVAYAIALRITSDPTLAEDVVQDAFLGAWRNAARYADSRGSVRTWLISIVHHRAIDALRRRRVTDALPEGDEPLPSPLTLPDVWAEVAGRLDSRAVREALGRLPDVQRETLELAYWNGLTQQEIAARTSTPLGTVKSRMRLGLLALRRQLIGGDGDGGSKSTSDPEDNADRTTQRRVGGGLNRPGTSLAESGGRFCLGLGPGLGLGLGPGRLIAAVRSLRPARSGAPG